MFSTTNTCSGKGAEANVHRSSSYVLTHRQFLRMATKKKEKAMSDSGVGYKLSPHTSSPKNKGMDRAAQGGATISRVVGDQRSQPASRDNVTEYTNSVSSSPEDYAVSTMIMALEKMAPQGQFHGTPIRSNRWGDEDDEGRQTRERLTILSRARSKMQSKQRSVDSSRVPFPKRRQSSPSQKDRQNAMGSVEIYKASSQEHQKHIDSEPRFRAPIKSALKAHARSDRSEGSVYTASRSSKQSNCHVRIRKESDCDDDLSVQSDPTHDSSFYDENFHRSEAGEAFLDRLIDLVTFDEEYSLDDETNQSMDEKGESARQGSHRYRSSRFMDKDEANENRRYGKTSSSCHSLDMGAELGKDVLSDISSALSFNKDDSSKCKPMEAPTETFSAVLSMNENSTDKEGADYESGCHMDSVFGMAQKQDKSMDTTIPTSEEGAPVQRIDSSAQMTYVSDVTSDVHQKPRDLTTSMDGVKQSFEQKSQSLFQAIKSPLSFASKVSGLASPLHEEPHAEEDDLEVKHETEHIKHRSGTPVPAFAPRAETVDNEASETESTGFQLPSSSFFYGLRSMVKSPIPFASNTNREKDSCDEDDNANNDELADDTASKVMPNIQSTFSKMSAAHAAASAKKEGRTCGTQGSFDEVMDSFQQMINCNRSTSGKNEEDKVEESLLSAISKSFSFWNKPTDDTNLKKSMESKACEEQSKPNGSLEKAEDFSAKSGEWVKMERDFPGSSFENEATLNLNDDRSETSLQKDVTITVETIKLTFSRTDVSGEENLQDEKECRVDVLAEDTHSESIKEEIEPQAETQLDEGFADFSQAENGAAQPNNADQLHNLGPAQTEQAEEEEFVVEDTSFSPPPSPQYKIPRQMPVLLTPPRPLRVDGLHTPEISAARQYRHLQNSSHWKIEQPKTVEDEHEEFKIAQSETWQSTDDLNTTVDSWQDFKSGDVFEGIWPEKSTSARSEKDQDEEPFNVTYKAKSSKWVRKYDGQQEKSPNGTALESPQSVSVYGKSNPEFNSFGRRSLLKALSGTTQAEF